jgi:AmmeMemoRadiSam system protein A/AmmeMemoRadiSam system protein B
MSVLNAIMVPHPPIILERIGKGEEKKIADIDEAYKKAADLIIESKPDTVVIISPHAPSYYDYMQISDGTYAYGNMGQFRDEEDEFEITYDADLVQEICRLAEQENLPAGVLGRQDGSLDHGTMIPLYYLQKLIPDTKFVRVSVGGPTHLMHYKLGEMIAKAAASQNKKIAVVGSGDLSHCQKENSSYGYRACGPEYDKKIMDVMGTADFETLLEMPESLESEAMVCGHKPFCVLAGTLDGYSVSAAPLAHSAEFGVGYGVVTFENPKEDETRHFEARVEEKLKEQEKERHQNEDELVALARKTLEAYLNNENFEEPHLSKDYAPAGCFVTLYKNGELRGCIGTTAPTRASLEEEIINNAISSATRDPRFPHVSLWELPEIDIKVDVLKEPEPIESEKQLDPKKYGVIVSKKGHRGLLLPDLEGVDTIEKQLSIAKQKAGLDPDEEDVSLQRFEVERHS